MRDRTLERQWTTFFAVAAWAILLALAYEIAFTPWPTGRTAVESARDDLRSHAERSVR